MRRGSRILYRASVAWGAPGGYHRPVLPLLKRRPSPQAAPARREELLSVELLEDRARVLAARFVVDPALRAVGGAYRRFEDDVRHLRKAYRTLADDAHRGAQVTPAAEWILADVATVRRAAGRLEGRLLSQPLAVFGPRVAELTAHALMDLLPVLGALGRAIQTTARAGGVV